MWSRTFPGLTKRRSTQKSVDRELKEVSLTGKVNTFVFFPLTFIRRRGLGQTVVPDTVIQVVTRSGFRPPIHLSFVMDESAWFRPLSFILGDNRTVPSPRPSKVLIL